MVLDLADKKSLVYDSGVAKKRKPEEVPPPETLDLNQVVAYNVREARLLRGWTQEDLADRLEPFTGTRLTQAGVSSIERGWDPERRRAFDAQEILTYALVFDLPLIWFVLPPPEDHRFIEGLPARASDLYKIIIGRHDQLEPVYQRLRELGIREPTEAEAAVEVITGRPSEAREWSYKERRKELLLALLDDHADNFDQRIDELGKTIDHLRQVGLRGFIAETTNDEDFTYKRQPSESPDETTSDDTSHQ